jgi:hypothetical protein
LKFRLSETAGHRRFGYPVHTVLPLHERAGGHYRLLKDGRPLAAQFRLVEGQGQTPTVALDFNANPDPLSASLYEIVHEPNAEPSDGPKDGLHVEKSAGLFQISSGGALRYEVPGNLLGFSRGVVNGRNRFVREGSQGLVVQFKDGRRLRLGAPEGIPLHPRIIREGPLAVAIGFTSKGDPRNDKHCTMVELTFPSSKSWIETTWGIEDEAAEVMALELELNLLLEEPPVLVDLGASSTVYTTLKPEERASLTAGNAPGLPRGASVDWSIQKTSAGRSTDFARASTELPLQAEGWAHVMDRQRCAAVALAGFGRTTRDIIEVEGRGRTRLRREFALNGASPAPGRKAITFWLHFVPMPVQVGAVTSPQAMLAPLRVVWEEN